MNHKIQPDTIVGNHYNKHETQNSFYRILVKNYKRTLQELVRDLPGNQCLEIGSGEGYIVRYVQEVRPGLQFIASDIDQAMIKSAAEVNPLAKWCVAQGEALPFGDQSFDIVLACEVLEHLYHPEVVLSEIRRVVRHHILISVPQEPIWRILNIMRLKYLRDLGNTPGHLQHWSTQSLCDTVGQYYQIKVVRIAFPWTFILAGV